MSREWSVAQIAGALLMVAVLTPMGVHLLEAQSAQGEDPAHEVQARRYQPISWPDEVSGKNFPMFAILEADPAAERRSRRRPS